MKGKQITPAAQTSRGYGCANSRAAAFSYATRRLNRTRAHQCGRPRSSVDSLIVILCGINGSINIDLTYSVCGGGARSRGRSRPA